ncbi:MAG TPA: Mrp/NBP35 family ATP-binding protein [Acidimicrobiales bacterium]|nr:Mrp/NBP35 family ATP-binding protein [Acidimicrobiales bacterium]
MTTGPVPQPPAADRAREDEVRQCLRAVIDPELGDTIVDLGMVRAVAVAGGDVVVDVALTIAACPLRTQIEKDVRGQVEALPWVNSVEIRIASMDAEQRAAVMARARWKAREDAPETAIPPDTRVLAIASGKGGVGKSSVTVNLAVALALRGLTVGILDADIWGFSVPRLLGMEGDVEARQGKMVPLEKPVGSGLVRVLSMGFLAGEEQAIMWRGLVLNRAVQQFLQDAHWGDLDYLLIDLPPGTGDVQMGLARLLPRTEMLLVTTPPLAAQKVAARAADMARKGYLRVAGVIENMSDFTCAHGTSYALFGTGGGERLARGLGVPLIGSIPLHPDLAAAGDEGTPVAAGQGELAGVFAELARVVAEEVAPLIQAQGCTARLMERVEAAVAGGEADLG